MADPNRPLAGARPTPDVDAPPAPAHPDVDVVMAIRNEADHLGAALDAVQAQAYPGTMRIFLGVGASSDGTDALAAQMAIDCPDIVAVANPDGSTPAGLNTAIRAGRAPIIVRVDGHCELCPGYIERAVSTLQRTGAANVGGMQVPTSATRFEDAVAAATTSWMGTGGASYRLGGVEGPVDTVYLGVFDRAAIEAVGLFDESLARNQDYELNIRLRESGREVWFDPELSAAYRPRGSWKALSRQYFDYGRWKAVVARKHPSSLRARQLIPAAATAAIGVSAVAGLRWRRLYTVPLAYGLAVLGAGAMANSAQPVTTAGVLACCHLSWGAGFLSNPSAAAAALGHTAAASGRGSG